MKLLREIIGRHLINGKVFEVISRSPKTIVVDADSEQVFVYQTGENGAVGISAVWSIRKGKDFRPFIDDSRDAAVIKILRNGKVESRLSMITEVKIKRRVA